jgi:hypothetical protein
VQTLFIDRPLLVIGAATADIRQLYDWNCQEKLPNQDWMELLTAIIDTCPKIICLNSLRKEAYIQAEWLLASGFWLLKSLRAYNLVNATE